MLTGEVYQRLRGIAPGARRRNYPRQVRLAFGIDELGNASEAIRAVYVLRRHQLARARGTCAPGHRGHRLGRKPLQQAASVARGERDRNIARNRCNERDPDFRGVQRQHEGEGVVYARVGVDGKPVGAHVAAVS